MVDESNMDYGRFGPWIVSAPGKKKIVSAPEYGRGRNGWSFRPLLNQGPKRLFSPGAETVGRFGPSKSGAETTFFSRGRNDQGPKRPPPVINSNMLLYAILLFNISI